METKNKIKNSFIKVSSIEPDALRDLIVHQVGEKAKEKMYNYLKDLAQSYPNFEEWFYEKVFPEVVVNDNKREIIIVISEIDDLKKPIIAGMAVLKKTESEKKICAFRIHEDYRSMGIGSELFEKCFEYLETRTPIITISEDRKEMFEYHIAKFNFAQVQCLKDYYKKGSIEYVYNGYLSNG